MITSALFHRPESEYAYLIDSTHLVLRFRTAKDDVTRVQALAGETYLIDEGWYDQPFEMNKYLSTKNFDYWNITIEFPGKRASYAFVAFDEAGEKVFFGDQGIFADSHEVRAHANNYFRLPYFHQIDMVKTPEWVKSTIWYQIFPERFANGNQDNDPAGVKIWNSADHPTREDFYGGDLQGVIDHLDHLVDLGINGLYLCPIFKAHSNHKYDTIDYLEIDQDFGDKETFRRLVQEAHKRGIKVMLDAVFNHMGDLSPQWQDVLENGADSRFADWFHVNKFPATYNETADFEHATDITYDTFAFTPHMPKLNTANPDVQKYLLQVATYWIDQFDIDAWRLDVANEVDHHFWHEFATACRAQKKDFYILGEIWHSSQSWLNGDQFDAVMNYAYTDAILNYFIFKQTDFETLQDQINSQLVLYRDPINEVQFNVLDSHDTPRLLTQAKDNLTLMQQTMAFTFLQPGVPCIYYGDEYAMTGAMDPDNRKPMVWDEDQQDLEQYAFVKKLIEFRKNNQKLLSAGSISWSGNEQVAIFTRQLDGKQIVGFFNTSGVEQNVPSSKILLQNNAQEANNEIILGADGFAILEV